MKIGFTGTQTGMTRRQIEEVGRRLEGATEFHHGDCIGSDALAHIIAATLGIRITVHPPNNSAKRAGCCGHVILPPLDYLERNHVIVDSTEKLLATPSGNEKHRSGTWATIRYAIKQGKPVCIVYPDGRVEIRKAK